MQNHVLFRFKTGDLRPESHQRNRNATTKARVQRLLFTT